jgi:Phage tail lysozyme
MAQLSYSDEVMSPPANSPVWFKKGSYPRGRAAVITAIKSVKSDRKPARDSGDAAGQPGSHSRRTSSSGSSGSSDSKGSSGSSAKARTPSCTGTAGMLPANYAAIVGFLTAHGYTGFAAAGIAGNIYQESGGNPESAGSGGGGLIGWTPLPAGFVTGSPAADLQTQLAAILTFNQQWAQYLPALNAATSATAAADIYMSDFERPGIPAAGSREAAASAVAQACGLLTGRPALTL